jgi:hypothetical protein
MQQLTQLPQFPFNYFLVCFEGPQAFYQHPVYDERWCGGNAYCGCMGGIALDLGSVRSIIQARVERPPVEAKVYSDFFQPCVAKGTGALASVLAKQGVVIVPEPALVPCTF